MRSRKECELRLLPKPLSGIARYEPSGPFTSAEKPPTGWTESGAGAGSVFGAAGKGAGQVASAGRIARAFSFGSFTRAAAGADATSATTSASNVVLSTWANTASRLSTRVKGLD